MCDAKVLISSQLWGKVKIWKHLQLRPPRAMLRPETSGVRFMVLSQIDPSGSGSDKHEVCASV
jgi:hypothetical protein